MHFLVLVTLQTGSTPLSTFVTFWGLVRPFFYCSLYALVCVRARLFVSRHPLLVSLAVVIHSPITPQLRCLRGFKLLLPSFRPLSSLRGGHTPSFVTAGHHNTFLRSLRHLGFLSSSIRAHSSERPLRFACLCRSTGDPQRPLALDGWTPCPLYPCPLFSRYPLPFIYIGRLLSPTQRAGQRKTNQTSEPRHNGRKEAVFSFLLPLPESNDCDPSLSSSSFVEVSLSLSLCASFLPRCPFIFPS